MKALGQEIIKQGRAAVAAGGGATGMALVARAVLHRAATASVPARYRRMYEAAITRTQRITLDSLLSFAFMLHSDGLAPASVDQAVNAMASAARLTYREQRSLSKELRIMEVGWRESRRM